MKIILSVLLTTMVLSTAPAYAKKIECAIQHGKNVAFLSVFVSLETEIQATQSGLEYISFKGFTKSGTAYNGGRVYFKNLDPQVAFQIKEYSDSVIQFEEADETEQNSYRFDLKANALTINMKRTKSLTTSKLRTLATGSYDCKAK